MKSFNNGISHIAFMAADEGGGDSAAGDVKVDAGKADAAADAGKDAGESADKGAAADAGKSSSLLGSADDVQDKAVTAPADFPEDWRDRMAGDDKELRKALDRYKSPADVAKANRDAQAKIRSGKTVNDDPMPDAEKDPEGAKAWREARGIPADPTGYAIPDTIKDIVTDADKPRLADFTEKMHAKGVPASAVGPVMEWYFQEQAAATEAIAVADRADAEALQDELRAEWGAEFKPNLQVAKRFADTITPGISWFDARLPDGRILGNVPEFVKALADQGIKEYGDVAFAGGDNQSKTLARKEELEAMQRNDPATYNANPKLSQEYQKIIEAELKRGAARGSNHSPNMNR